MTISTEFKARVLLQHFKEVLAFTEQVSGDGTSSPTSSKNAGWVHVEFRNQVDPASLLLYIRDKSPESVALSLKSDIKLLEFVAGTISVGYLSSLPEAVIDWVDDRYETVFSKE